MNYGTRPQSPIRHLIRNMLKIAMEIGFYVLLGGVFLAPKLRTDMIQIIINQIMWQLRFFGIAATKMTYRQHCYGSFSKHMATWPPAQSVNNNGQHTDTCTCGQVCLAVRLLSHGWPLPITHLLSKSSTCVHHGTPLLHQGACAVGPSTAALDWSSPGPSPTPCRCARGP